MINTLFHLTGSLDEDSSQASIPENVNFSPIEIPSSATAPAPVARLLVSPAGVR